MEYRRCKNLTVILILIFSIFLYFLYFLNLYFAKFFSIKEEKRYREMTKSVDPNQIYGRVNFTRGFGEVGFIIDHRLFSRSNIYHFFTEKFYRFISSFILL